MVGSVLQVSVLAKFSPFATLIHYAAAENSQSEDEEYYNGNAQAQDYPAEGEGGQCVTIKGGYHRITQSLGGISQWVEEGNDLEPLDRVERAPG